MDYGNTKITCMHLYPRGWNVAAQVAEELKMVTYATPPMEEHRKGKKMIKRYCFLWAVGATGHVHGGEAEDHLLGDVSHHCHHLRHLVALCAHRPHHGGGLQWQPGLAFLDQADRGGHRLHGGTGVYVRAVQDVRPADAALALLQQGHTHRERARDGGVPSERSGQDQGQDGGGGRHHKFCGPAGD